MRPVCLNNFNLIFLRHITGDSVMNDMYIIACQYLLHCYKDLIDLHYKLQNFIFILVI